MKIANFSRIFDDSSPYKVYHMSLQLTQAVSLLQEVEMTVVEDISNVIRNGGCVVMGVGVTPEKYRSLLEGATDQDYLVIGAKDSKDAEYIASKMSAKPLGPKSLSVLGLEIHAYLIKN